MENEKSSNGLNADLLLQSILNHPDGINRLLPLMKLLGVNTPDNTVNFDQLKEAANLNSDEILQKALNQPEHLKETLELFDSMGITLRSNTNNTEAVQENVQAPSNHSLFALLQDPDGMERILQLGEIIGVDTSNLRSQLSQQPDDITGVLARISQLNQSPEQTIQNKEDKDGTK